MKVTITNKGEMPKAAPGYVTVGVGETKTLSGCNKEQVAQLMRLADRNYLVAAEPDAADNDIAVADMLSPADPAADALTRTGVGFTLKDSAGSALSITEKVAIGLFSDALCTTPHSTATVSAIATGTIDAGTGTNRADLTTNGSAAISLTIAIPAAANTTVYVRALMRNGGTRVLNCTEIDAVSFTKT